MYGIESLTVGGCYQIGSSKGILIRTEYDTAIWQCLYNDTVFETRIHDSHIRLLSKSEINSIKDRRKSHDTFNR